MKFFKQYINAYIKPHEHDRGEYSREEWREHFSEAIEKKLKGLFPNQMVKSMEVNREKATPRLKVYFYSSNLPYVYIRDYPRNIEVTNPDGVVFHIPLDGKL